MALVNRYTNTDFLKLVHVGNAIGMANSTGGGFNFDTFISLDPNLDSGQGVPSSFDPNTFAGTTNNWQENGSWARLQPDPSDVPVGSTVDYALLVWGVQTGSGITAAIVDATTITLGLPDTTTVPITVDPTFNDAGGTQFLTRAREVTSILQGLPNSGFGDYSLSGIPTRGPASNGAGWSIIIVYKHPDMRLRNISVFTGILNNGQTTPISGFFTPTVGTVDARAYVMALYGDSDFGGDTFTLNGTRLSGPRNPETNFFASQVNDYLGNLATISSFGDRNVTPGQVPRNQKAQFDVTNVDASGILGNGVTSANVGIGAGGDVITANAVAVEINSNEAILDIVKSVDKTTAEVGDTLTYTLAISNIGGAEARDVILVDTIPDITSFNSGSLTINGVSDPGNVETGANIGNIPVSSTTTVTFIVTILTGITLPNTAINSAYAGYEFESFPGAPIINNGATSNDVSTRVLGRADLSNISKSVDKDFADCGDTLTYTIVVPNDGNVTALNVIFTDTIPNDTIFVTDSVTVNGVTQPGINPQNGVSLGEIGPGNTSTLTFQVIIDCT